MLISDSITELPATVDNVVTSTGFSLILFYLRFILLFASPFPRRIFPRRVVCMSADITYRSRIQIPGMHRRGRRGWTFSATRRDVPESARRLHARSLLYSLRGARERSRVKAQTRSIFALSGYRDSGCRGTRKGKFRFSQFTLIRAGDRQGDRTSESEKYRGAREESTEINREER